MADVHYTAPKLTSEDFKLYVGETNQEDQEGCFRENSRWNLTVSSISCCRCLRSNAALQPSCFHYFWSRCTQENRHPHLQKRTWMGPTFQIGKSEVWECHVTSLRWCRIPYRRLYSTSGTAHLYIYHLLVLRNIRVWTFLRAPSTDFGDNYFCSFARNLKH